MASYYWGEVLCWKHKRKSHESNIRRKVLILGKNKYNSMWQTNIGERPMFILVVAFYINTFNFHYFGFLAGMYL